MEHTDDDAAFGSTQVSYSVFSATLWRKWYVAVCVFIKSAQGSASGANLSLPTRRRRSTLFSRAQQPQHHRLNPLVSTRKPITHLHHCQLTKGTELDLFTADSLLLRGKGQKKKKGNGRPSMVTQHSEAVMMPVVSPSVTPPSQRRRRRLQNRWDR